MKEVMDVIKARKSALVNALDDARNGVPIKEDEYYESDAHYEAAIETLEDLIKELEGE